MLIFLIMLPGFILLIPTVVLFIEVVLALPRKAENSHFASPRSMRVGIIVPAHNEGAGLLPTLHDLQSQITVGDRIVVVADNCSDDTAAISAMAGVEVVVRNDGTRLGKGYALSAGMQHLSSDPPDLVLFCDADCRLQPNVIELLAMECERSHRPVQACYLMKRAPDAATDQAFAEFAWKLKNLVRPLGLRNLRGPCQLMGTGMMFPWDVIRAAPLASGNLVEDLQLGLDLALKGSAPLFVPSAVTTSVFPSSENGAETQRKRWVEGHLATITGQVPRLLAGAGKRGDLNLLVLALDLAVPPIVLLAALLIGAWCIAAAAVLVALPVSALLPATTGVALLGTSLVAAWARFGNDRLLVLNPLKMTTVVAAKSRVYMQLAQGKKSGCWVRTERDDVKSSALLLAPELGCKDNIEANNVGLSKIR